VGLNKWRKSEGGGKILLHLNSHGNSHFGPRGNLKSRVNINE
jgi:hypothetical protein